MSSRYSRAKANLMQLESAARKLEKLNDEVVYLGGCTTGLFITDPLSLDFRPTLDVDCVVDVISLSQYYKFEKELQKRGFAKSIQDDINCRWHCENIILDVMPADEKILGFGSPWFKEAIRNAVSYHLAGDLTIKSFTASYFLATKIAAFKTRGNSDFLSSHDFEDIITVIAGRNEIVDEVISSENKLKTYLKTYFKEMLRDDQFKLILPGHLNDGPVTMQRVQTVLQRIEKMVE